MVGYVTALLLFVAYTQPGRWAVSVIFEKLPYAISLYFSPIWHQLTFVFSDVLIKENFSVSKYD